MTSMRRNDVASTSFRRCVPIRFLISQCQIITFLILKYDIIENSMIELRGIVLPVQMGGLLGAKGYVGPPPLKLFGGGGGGAGPPPGPPSSYAYATSGLSTVFADKNGLYFILVFLNPALWLSSPDHVRVTDEA